MELSTLRLYVIILLVKILYIFFFISILGICLGKYNLWIILKLVLLREVLKFSLQFFWMKIYTLILWGGKFFKFSLIIIYEMYLMEV